MGLHFRLSLGLHFRLSLGLYFGFRWVCTLGFRWVLTLGFRKVRIKSRPRPTLSQDQRTPRYQLRTQLNERTTGVKSLPVDTTTRLSHPFQLDTAVDPPKEPHSRRTLLLGGSVLKTLYEAPPTTVKTSSCTARTTRGVESISFKQDLSHAKQERVVGSTEPNQQQEIVRTFNQSTEVAYAPKPIE